MLELKNISFSYQKQLILNDLSLSVEDGEIVALLGRSGIGKSTLLRIIAGLLMPDDGAIIADEVDVTAIPPHKRNIGLVFQNNALFPHLTVRQNIEYGLRRVGSERSIRNARVNALLTKMQISSLRDRKVDTLSGGEAKRVAVARTLATAPRVVLLDEPLTGLDPDTYMSVRNDVLLELRSGGTSVIWVTHDEAEAASVADRIIRL